MNMADDAEARRLYGLIREKEPQNAAAVAGLARLRARKRDYSGVLEALEENTTAPGDANLNEVALKMAAYRRLGRPGQAAEAASRGLGELLAFVVIAAADLGQSRVPCEVQRGGCTPCLVQNER